MSGGAFRVHCPDAHCACTDGSNELQEQERNPVARAREVHLLFVTHYAQIVARCENVLRDRSLADEAAQESFLALSVFLERRDRADCKVAVLLAIAGTTARSVARREWMRRRVEAYASTTNAVDGTPEYLARACTAELSDALIRAIAQLPAKQQLVAQETLQGASVQEISLKHSLHRSTVQMHLARAHVKLRRALRDFGDEDTSLRGH